MYAVMDDSWRNWVQENLERGCESEEIFRVLLENNFSPKEIRNAMGVEFPAHSPLVHTGIISPTAQPPIEKP